MTGPGQLLTLNVRGGARICVPRDINQITTYILLAASEENVNPQYWSAPG